MPRWLEWVAAREVEHARHSRGFYPLAAPQKWPCYKTILLAPLSLRSLFNGFQAEIWPKPQRGVRFYADRIAICESHPSLGFAKRYALVTRLF